MLSAEHVADVQGATREEEVEEEGDQDAYGEQQVEAGEPDHNVLSMSIIVLVIMVIILTMGYLIKLVTVILPADGFGSNNLVATFNPMKSRNIIKLQKNNAQDLSTSDTSMVNAVMAAVDMKSAPALTVASVPDDPM